MGRVGAFNSSTIDAKVVAMGIIGRCCCGCFAMRAAVFMLP